MNEVEPIEQFLKLKEETNKEVADLEILDLEISKLNFLPIKGDFKQLRPIDVYLEFAFKQFERYPSQIIVENRLCAVENLFLTLTKLGTLHYCNDTRSTMGMVYNSLFYFEEPFPNKSGFFILLGGMDYSFINKSNYNISGDYPMKNGRILASSQVTFFINPSAPKTRDIINSLIKNVNIFIEEKATPITIELITKSEQGKLNTTSIPINDNNIDLALHYGKDFKNYDESLINLISKTNKGLFMFHGPPGTGKTSYIRNLIPKLSKLGKRVLLIPKYIIAYLETPEFNEFMIERFRGTQEIIFIIEDAESLISSKAEDGSDRSSLISTVLNLTDGILNDIFHISIFITFNTKLDKIDPALTRKGRLLAKYYFDLLSYEDALALAKHLGVDDKLEIGKSYALCDIYGMKDKDLELLTLDKSVKPKSKIGL